MQGRGWGLHGEALHTAQAQSLQSQTCHAVARQRPRRAGHGGRCGPQQADIQVAKVGPAYCVSSLSAKLRGRGLISGRITIWRLVF